MKNASVRSGAIPRAKQGTGKPARSAGMHSAARKYTNRARATSKATSNI